MQILLLIAQEKTIFLNAVLHLNDFKKFTFTIISLACFSSFKYELNANYGKIIELKKKEKLT